MHKISNKEKKLKVARFLKKKQQQQNYITYRETKIRIAAVSSTETMQARPWNTEGKRLLTQNSRPSENTFQKKKQNTFSDV